MKKSFAFFIIIMMFCCKNIYASTLKVGISGQDTIINNINKPYTQEQIQSIANITVLDSSLNDITSKLILSNDEWSANKNIKGVFQQEYSVSLNEEVYYYKLNILNVDFTDQDEDDQTEIPNKPIIIRLNSEYRRPLTELIQLIEEQINIEILDYIVIEDNYTTKYNVIGKHKVKIRINNNPKNIYEILIDVYEQENKSKTIFTFKNIIITSFVLIVISGIATSLIIKNKRRKNEEN